MEKFDVLIIGGGPAAMTAAVYVSRANLKAAYIESGAPGGKLLKTHNIENWTGDKAVSGVDLALRMYAHSTEFGAKHKFGKVTKIDSEDDFKKIVTLENGEQLEAKAVIIATGMIERVPETVENIKKFDGRGVSYCAICDGPLYKGQDTAIIGGGNAAVEEGMYLSSIAKSVKIFVRKEEELWAEDILVQELKAKDNVEFIMPGEILALEGDDKVSSMRYTHNGEEKTADVAAVFPYIGQIASSQFVSHLEITDERGFVITDETMETPVKNIFAIGDIRVKPIRQIANAVGDGAVAGKLVANAINSHQG